MDFTSDTMWNQAGGAPMSNNTQVWPRPLAPRPPPPPPPPQNRPNQPPVDAPFYRREKEAPTPKQSKKKGGKSKGKGKQSPAGKVSPVGKAQGHGRPQREAARQNVAVKALMSKKFRVSPGKAAKNATAAKTAALLKTAASKIAKKAKEVPVKSAEQVAEEIRLRAMKNTANKIKTLLKKSKPTTTSAAGTSSGSGSAWLSAPEHESAAAASGPRVSRNLMGEMEFSSTDWQAIGSGGLVDTKGAADPRAEDSDVSQDDDAVEIIERETEQPEVISIADEDDTAGDDVDEDDEENDGDVQVEEARTTASNAAQTGEETVVSSRSQDPSGSDIHLEGDGVSASSQCIEPNAGSERATLDEFDAADITWRRRRRERRGRLADASGPAAAVSPAVLAVLAGDESDSSAAAPSPVQLPRLEESPTGRPVVSSPLVGARSEADLQACVDFQPVVRIKRQPGLDDAVMSGSGSGRSSRSGTPPVSTSSRPATPRVGSRQPESSVVAGDWFASLIPDPVRKEPVETPPVRRPKKTRAKPGALLSSKSRAKPGSSKSSRPSAQIAKKSTTKSSALPSESSVSSTEQSVPSNKQTVPSTKPSVSATKPNVVATIPAVLRIRPSSLSNKAPVISLSTTAPTIRPLVPSVRPSVPSASSIRPSAIRPSVSSVRTSASSVRSSVSSIRPSVRPSASSARSSVTSAPSSASIGTAPRSVGEKDPVVFVLPRTEDARPGQGRKRRVSDTHTSPGEEWRFAAPSKRVRSSSECSVLGDAPTGRPQPLAPPGEAGSLVRRLMKMGKESLRTAVDDPSLLRSRRIMSELMRAYRGQQTRRMEQERFSAVASGGGSPVRRESEESLSAEVLSDLSQMLATEEGSSRPPLASPPPSGLLSAARLGLGPRTVAPKPGTSRVAGPGGSGTSPASGGGGRGRVAQSVAEAFARRASQIQRPTSSSPRREDSPGGARSQGAAAAGSARGASGTGADPDIVELPTPPALSGRARFAALDGSAARPGSAVCSSAQDRPRSPPRVVVSAAAAGAVRGKAPLTAGEVFSGPPPPLGRSLRPNVSGAGRGGGGGGRKPWECRSCFAQSWVNTCRIFRRNVTLIDKDVGRVADELSGREPDWENLLRMSLVENTLLAQVEEMEEQVIVLQGEMRRLRQMCRHLRDVRIRCMSYGSDVRPEDFRLPPEVQQLLRRMAGHAPGAATSSGSSPRGERGERRDERRREECREERDEEGGGRSEDRDARASQSTQQSSPHGEPRDQGGGGDGDATATSSAFAADAGPSCLPGGVRIKQDPDAVPDFSDAPDAATDAHNTTDATKATRDARDATLNAPDASDDARTAAEYTPTSGANAVKPDPVSVAAAWAAMHVDEDEVSLARAIVRVRNESELNEMAAAFLSAQPPEEDDSRAGQQPPPPQFGEIHQDADLPQAIRQTGRQDSQDSQNSVDPEHTPGMAYLGHIDSSSEMYKALLALAQHNGNRVMLHVAPDPCPAPEGEGQIPGEGEMQYRAENMEVDEGDEEQRINVAEMAAVKMESGDEEEEMGESVETARQGAPETAETGESEAGHEGTTETAETTRESVPENAEAGEAGEAGQESMETGEKSSGGSKHVQNGTENTPTKEADMVGEKEKRNDEAGDSGNVPKGTENTGNGGESANKPSTDSPHNHSTTTGESSLNTSAELPVKKSKKKKKKKKHKHDHHHPEQHQQQQQKQQEPEKEQHSVGDLLPPSAVSSGSSSNGSRTGADIPHRRRSFSERSAEDLSRSLVAGTGRAGRRRTVSERGDTVRWQLEPVPPPCRVRSVPSAPAPVGSENRGGEDSTGESSTPTAVPVRDAATQRKGDAVAKEDDAVAIRTQLDDLGVPIVSVQLHGPCVFVLTTDMVVHRYTLPASFVHSMCTLQVVCDSTPLWSEPSSLPRPRPTCMVVKQTGPRVSVIVGDDTGALTLLQQVKEGVSPTRGGGSGDAGEERPTLRRVQVGSAVRSLAIKAARLYIGGDAFFAVLNVERLLALETLPEEDGRPLPVRFWRSGSGFGGGGALLRWHALDSDVACVRPARAADSDAVVLSLRGRPLQIRDGADGELLASVGPRAADQGCHLTTRWGHALYTLRPPTAAGDTSAASATTCCFTAVHLDSASFAGGGWRLQQPITALDADGDHLYVGHLDGSLRMMLCDQKASGASGLRLRSVRQLHGASSSPLQAVAARADKVVTGSSSGRVEMFVLHAS